jgi:hypothetical protein
VTIAEALAMASTLPASYIGIEAGGHISAEWDPGQFQLRINSVATD